MTAVAASDFRQPSRNVRLDTILRLRWLAALGQLTAIFIVARGLEFDVPVISCVAIVGVSALLNLALQIAFNPMQRLEPVYAAALLALNLVELAALLFLTGGLRSDDHSAFGQNFDRVYYPKVSASWVLSEEPFWNLGLVNALKLRAAYGQSGQQPANYDALRTYQPTAGPGDVAAAPKEHGCFESHFA